MLTATAVLRAVGYVPIPETSPSRPAQLHMWRPAAVDDHQQTTWHAGWAVVAGRSRAIGRPENARPLLAG